MFGCRPVLALCVASSLLVFPGQQTSVGQRLVGAFDQETLSRVRGPEDVQDTAEVAAAFTRAEAAAEEETSELFWFSMGCLLNVIGVVVAYRVNPSPPQSYLIGKSPDYVAAFGEAYAGKASSIQGKYAAMGCVIGTVGLALLGVLALHVALESLEPFRSF